VREQPPTQGQLANPFASLDESRPAAPVITRQNRSVDRERFLKEAGYTILPVGDTKTIRVNRAWITEGGQQKAHQGGDEARWLLFVNDAPPIPASEILSLDETQTEIEIIYVAKEVKHGCTTVTEKQPVRSAYMITTGRVAYRAATT
jgi:hypothetical protein